LQPHQNHNHVFNHVAISVPDCDKAVEWYQDIFGFRRIRSDRTTDRGETPDAPIFRIYGNDLKKVKCAWLEAGNGVGFEIFEFQDPQYKQPQAFEYNRGGFFHIAITVPDPNATAKKFNELGGKQIGETVQMYGEEALYVADPWGNVIECLSCSLTQLVSTRISRSCSPANVQADGQQRMSRIVKAPQIDNIGLRGFGSSRDTHHASETAIFFVVFPAFILSIMPETSSKEEYTSSSGAVLCFTVKLMAFGIRSLIASHCTAFILGVYLNLQVQQGT